MYNLVSNPVGAETMSEGEVPQGMALKKGTQDIGLSALHNHSRSAFSLHETKKWSSKPQK